MKGFYISQPKLIKPKILAIKPKTISLTLMHLYTVHVYSAFFYLYTYIYTCIYSLYIVTKRKIEVKAKNELFGEGYGLISYLIHNFINDYFTQKIRGSYSTFSKWSMILLQISFVFNSDSKLH